MATIQHQEGSEDSNTLLEKQNGYLEQLNHRYGENTKLDITSVLDP